MFHSRKETEISHQLIKIINNIINTEIESEQLKITLAENIRFDITHAFRSIDTHQKGYILPNDLFQFMARNSYSVSIKICSFLIYILSQGQNYLNYHHFLAFIVPKYDKQASMACIARKLPISNQLSFYFEEFLSRLIWKELEYHRNIEIEKIKLAQLCEWKFMTVFKLISNTQHIDKKMFDQFLHNMGNQHLSDKEYIYFMTRFNRNNDKLIQKDEFSDAIFPNGYLLNNQSEDRSDPFEQYVKNHNNQLDHYLGKQHNDNIDDENYQFVPENHQFRDQQLQAQEGFVVDHSNRQYLAMDPQFAISNIVPIPQKKIIQQEFSPSPPPQKDYIQEEVPIFQTFSPNRIGNVDPNTLLKHYNISVQPNRNVFNQRTQQTDPSYDFLNQSPQYIRHEDYVSPPKEEQPINIIQGGNYKKDLLNPFVGKGGNTNELQKNQQVQKIYQPQQQIQQYQPLQKQQTGKFTQSQDLSESVTQSQIAKYLQQPSNKDMLMMK